MSRDADMIIQNAIDAGTRQEIHSLQSSIFALVTVLNNAEENLAASEKARESLSRAINDEREHTYKLQDSVRSRLQAQYQAGLQEGQRQNLHHFVEMMDNIRAGKKIYAVKALRHLTGVGLREAKDYIDMMCDTFGTSTPKTQSSDCGCNDCKCQDEPSTKSDPAPEVEVREHVPTFSKEQVTQIVDEIVGEDTVPKCDGTIWCMCEECQRLYGGRPF
jgi:ribosomal protein L7/L12